MANNSVDGGDCGQQQDAAVFFVHIQYKLSTQENQLTQTMFCIPDVDCGARQSSNKKPLKM